MKRLFLLLLAGFTIGMLTPALAGGTVYASDHNDLFDTCDDPAVRDATLCRAKQERDTSGRQIDDNSILGPNGILAEVAQLLLIIVGILSVVMIIIGGFKYVLSAGDPSKINSAKNTILYALIGLVVALSAQLILLFVVNAL